MVTLVLGSEIPPGDGPVFFMLRWQKIHVKLRKVSDACCGRRITMTVVKGRNGSPGSCLGRETKSIQGRIRASQPCDIDAIDWSNLDIAVNVGSLQFHGGSKNDLRSEPVTRKQSTYVEISSGGTVFFCLLGSSRGDACVVVKFISDRLLCQSEQFAAEIAHFLKINNPKSRIVHQEEDLVNSEWNTVRHAASLCGKKCEEFILCMNTHVSFLVLEHIPGLPLKDSISEAVSPERLSESSHTLGKILALDMILGNPDRLSCARLSWPGNPSNLVFCQKGRFQGAIVCFDAVVQRKPPHSLTSVEDAACEQLAELAYNDIDTVFEVLENALFSTSTEECDVDISHEAAKACQRGMIETFQRAMGLRGIFEMLYQQIDDWIDEFVQDMEAKDEESMAAGEVTAKPPFSPRNVEKYKHSASLMTNTIRTIQKEAGKDENLSRKLEDWNILLGSKCVELRNALEKWQSRLSDAGQCSNRHEMTLTTGFLQGIRPVVDLYELKVRLQHMLHRQKILGAALSSESPSMLFHNVYISGAVAANSFHVLTNIGITHILNATEDLFPPGDPRSTYIADNFDATLRLPLRDDEDEPIWDYFEEAAQFIQSSIDQNDKKILVHCHAGQSRSCALVIAWLILKRNLTLKDSVILVQQARPQAAPNSGYMNALGRLEERVHGVKTVKVKKTKPETLTCGHCGKPVGLSKKTLDLHVKMKHPDAR